MRTQKGRMETLLNIAHSSYKHASQGIASRDWPGPGWTWMYIDRGSECLSSNSKATLPIGGYNTKAKCVGFITAGTCTEYTRQEAMKRHAPTAAIQYSSHSHPSWVSPCTHHKHWHLPQPEPQGTWFQGAWKEEEVLSCQTSCSFKARLVSEVWNDWMILWHVLVVWRAVYEYCLSSAPFIATAWSHCMRVSGRTQCTVPVQNWH